MTWYVTKEADVDMEPDYAAWTVSEDPNQAGWATDYSARGYGLTKEKAQLLADAANKAAEYMTGYAKLHLTLWTLIRQSGGKVEISMAEMIDGQQPGEIRSAPPSEDRPLILTIEALDRI